MRLIDADNISFYCNYEGDCTGDINDCKKCGNYICNFRDIQEQPTAYDIDKVVEELKDELAYWKAEHYHQQIADAKAVSYAHAIEIVKQGGISDDVCECRIVDRPHNLPIYNTSCGKIRLQYVTGVDIYCNGCGKKIKVVDK